MGADIPAPVALYLRLTSPDSPPGVETIVMEASGRFRRRPLPWIPMRNTIWVRPGVDRVSDLLVRIGPFTVMRVLDAFVDGHGITKFLRTADVGPEIDQGALHAMLCEAIMFPSSWSRMPGLAWEQVDEHTANVRLPFQGGTEVATVGFDPTTGFPATYRTTRFKVRGGPKIDWRIDMLDWQRFGVVVVPRRIVVTWADEPGPWLTMRITSVTPGQDVAPALARARAAIKTATRRPAEGPHR